MKVCILSMQHVPNFGSLLQAYSLKKILNGFGHEVHFIDIEPNEHENALMEEYAVTFQTDSEGESGILGKLKKIDKYAFNRIKIKLQSDKQWQVFDGFRKTVLGISPSDNMLDYDYCVIGSDEVFNCMAKTPWGFTSQLFGNVNQAKEVITYAASCGSTVYENLPEKVRKRIKESFQRIKAFSVRDVNTLHFTNMLTDKKVFEHLDPVLIGDFSKEMKLEEDAASGKLPQKYCIVYSYYNRIHEKKEIDAIIDFCRKNHMTIVTVGAPQKWCANHLVLTPFETLVAFEKSAFVITDTFHGTIFSARYANRFAIITRESNQNKVLDLVNRLSIDAHTINDIAELSKVYGIVHEKTEINKYLSTQREASIKYLETSIS